MGMGSQAGVRRYHRLSGCLPFSLSPTTDQPDNDGPTLRTPPTGVPFESDEYQSLYKI
jgi:hypothetical protein